MNTRDNDPVRHILVVDTHDLLLFFTSRGRVLPLKTYELRPDTSRNTRGVPVVNVIPLSGEEQVEAIIGVKSLDQPDLYLVMATQQGSVKRTALNSISNIRRAGLIIFNLRDKDMLVTARLAHESDDVMMVTEQGMSIRFPVQDVKPRLRAAGGVRGMMLSKRDRIVSMDMVIPDSKLLVISKNGYGKLTYLKSYPSQGRGGLGVKTMSVTKRTGKVAAAEVIADSDEVYVVSEQAQVIRTNLSEIRSTGRATQGVRIFNPKEGDAVASISCVGEFEVPEEKVVQVTPTVPPAPLAPDTKRNGGPPSTGRLFE
jgi:DNA gyrase subunit A